MKKILILGAGITGLSASNALKEDYMVQILEKNKFYGGLCQSFEIGGFWFDYGSHMAFTKNKKIKNLLEQNIETTKFDCRCVNYKDNIWIKHPVQNNLYKLPAKEKVEIIKSFVEKKDNEQYCSYADWLQKKYGYYFAINYPYLYTRKYWTVEPEQLETKWIANRIYTPTIEEVLYGSYSEDTRNIGLKMRYPKKGGFAQFLKTLSVNSNIMLDATITKIIPEKKLIICNREIMTYDEIISTIPLPELIKQLECVPSEVKSAVERLSYTSMILVSFGLQVENLLPDGAQAAYIYDIDKLPVRIYSTSACSKENAPKGCSTLQVEVYESKYKKIELSIEEIKDKVIHDLIKMGLFRKEDIILCDIRRVPYAYVMFEHNTYENRKVVLDYLDDKEIITAGRFGRWEYLWSDQSILSGEEAARKVRRTT